MRGIGWALLWAFRGMAQAARAAREKINGTKRLNPAIFIGACSSGMAATNICQSPELTMIWFPGGAHLDAPARSRSSHGATMTCAKISSSHYRCRGLGVGLGPAEADHARSRPA